MKRARTTLVVDCIATCPDRSDGLGIYTASGLPVCRLPLSLTCYKLVMPPLFPLFPSCSCSSFLAFDCITDKLLPGLMSCQSPQVSSWMSLSLTTQGTRPPAIASSTSTLANEAPAGRKIDRACDFCRRRKTRCDGGLTHHSKCTNCRRNNALCTYL